MPIASDPQNHSPRKGIGTAAALAVQGLFAAAAVGGHYALTAAGLLDAGTLWFAVTGAAFLAVTWASHRVIARAGSAGSTAPAPVATLLLSMVIRLSGTFVILAAQLIFLELERREAVFNVLFWYITLTSLDLLILIRGTSAGAAASPASATPGGDPEGLRRHAAEAN